STHPPRWRGLTPAPARRAKGQTTKKPKPEDDSACTAKTPRPAGRTSTRLRLGTTEDPERDRGAAALRRRIAGEDRHLERFEEGDDRRLIARREGLEVPFRGSWLGAVRDDRRVDRVEIPAVAPGRGVPHVPELGGEKLVVRHGLERVAGLQRRGRLVTELRLVHVADHVPL